MLHYAKLHVSSVHTQNLNDMVGKINLLDLGSMCNQRGLEEEDIDG